MKPSPVPWISPKIEIDSSVLRFLTSTVREFLISSRPTKSLLSSWLTEGLFSKFLEMIESSFSKF
jgi:hypothetical protein